MKKKKIKILLIEDEPSLNKIIKLKLEETGCLVDSVFTAEEGLEVLKNYPPDLIWLDIYLPGMSGLEFLKKIRKDPLTADQKVIIVSVSVSNKKIELAEELRAIDYLVKSNYTIEELVTKVVGTLKEGRK